MRVEVVRLCGAGLLAIWIAGCGDSPAKTEQAIPSTTGPVSVAGADSAGSGGVKASPQSAGNTPTEPIPAGSPAVSDSGRPAPVPMDAGAPKLDAAMAPPAVPDDGEAGAPMPGADDAAAGEPMTTPSLPTVSSVTMDGPFMTSIDENAGPGRAGLVVRPAMLGENGLKHPIFIWGPGRGTRVIDYESVMRRIASHGFVVYSEISRAADGTEMVAAMTWLSDENKRSSSPYFQMLDESKLAVGGHSFGSNSAMTASSDPRVKAFVHTAGSGFRGAGKALNLRQPAAFICGEDDPTANVTDCRTDYMQTSSPVFFTILAGEDHLSTVRAGLPLIVAWLRWHLGGENDRKEMFIGADCDFCTGVYTSQNKNWQ